MSELPQTFHKHYHDRITLPRPPISHTHPGQRTSHALSLTHPRQSGTSSHTEAQEERCPPPLGAVECHVEIGPVPSPAAGPRTGDSPGHLVCVSLGKHWVLCAPLSPSGTRGWRNLSRVRVCAAYAIDVVTKLRFSVLKIPSLSARMTNSL